MRKVCSAKRQAGEEDVAVIAILLSIRHFDVLRILKIRNSENCLAAFNQAFNSREKSWAVSSSISFQNPVELCTSSQSLPSIPTKTRRCPRRVTTTRSRCEASTHSFTFFCRSRAVTVFTKFPPLSCFLAFAGSLEHNLPDGKYHKTTDSRWPINLKITAVEGKDSAQLFALGDAHQSGVGQVHRQIAILTHQLFHARNVIDA